ncbi:amino acid permease-domain-containing protein [Powellomyces hirtus]|nr:amino acid permease-domain-containing protein [Powellomyces hirtus]
MGKDCFYGAFPGSCRTPWEDRKVRPNRRVQSYFNSCNCCHRRCTVYMWTFHCRWYSGQYAPISLLLVCIVVFIYRFIFAELGSIPLNGGVYSLLLVGSTKFVAAMAACCSILDLSASAVVSAATASNYFYGQWGIGNVYALTIGVLALFAVLALAGMKDSANVSLVIFWIHLATMIALILASLVHWGRNGSDTLVANWNAPSPTGNVAYDIFNGFCLGMLGFTGMEQCPNYIEEQKPGVYPKVMRNIAYLVLCFTPVITFLMLVVIPRNEIEDNVNFALSYLGDVTGGRPLEMIGSINACIVLCGGVLCAFVGIVGLMGHMANDHLLPQFLLNSNRFTHSYHSIILSFFLLCVLLVVVTSADVMLLSLLFALCFLFVLAMFAIANLLLKYKRGRLRRIVTTSWITVLIGLVAVVAAIVGNSISSPSMIAIFAAFFGVLFAAMVILINEVPLLRFLVFITDNQAKMGNITNALVRRLKVARSHPVAFFTNHDEIHVLNKAVLYVAQNEPTMHLQIVHFFEDVAHIPLNLEPNCHILDHVYPKISIDLILVKGTFSPSSVACMAKALGISRNQCYITCPGENSNQIGDFGGARIIML